MSEPKSDKTDYESLLPRFPTRTGIPKTIFQICLLGKKKCPSAVYEGLTNSIKDNIDFLKQNNPEWNYKLISDTEADSFIQEVYGADVLRYYNRISPLYRAAKADMLRLLLIYKYGGVYIDLKCSLQNPLDEVIKKDDSFFLMYYDIPEGGRHNPAIPDYIEKGEILQGLIVSSSGHAFIRSAIISLMRNIDLYNPYIDGTGWMANMSVTGPGMYTKTIFPLLGSSDKYRYVRPFADMGFELFFGGNSYNGGEYQKSVRFTDYRKLCCPLVKHNNRFVNLLNIVYLRILSKWSAVRTKK